MKICLAASLAALFACTLAGASADTMKAAATPRAHASPATKPTASAHAKKMHGKSSMQVKAVAPSHP